MAVPSDAELDALMKRCQNGIVPWASSWEEVHQLAADCYAAIGSLRVALFEAGKIASDLPDRALWCPRCGGEMVRPLQTQVHEVLEWTWWCDGCTFGGRNTDTVLAIPNRDEAIKYARRLVRAELARQALELRAHSVASESAEWVARPLYDCFERIVKEYRLLGEYPLRLPGEDAR